MLFSCVFTRRRYFYENLNRQNPDERPFYSCSRLIGLACDTFSLVFVMLVLTIYCSPTVGPVITTEVFNWTPLFLGFVLILSLLGWCIHGRNHYMNEVVIEGVCDGTSTPGLLGQNAASNAKKEKSSGNDPCSKSI